MAFRQNRVGWLGSAAGVLWASCVWQAGSVGAQESLSAAWRLSGTVPIAHAPSIPLAPDHAQEVPIEKLPEAVRESVRRVMEKPTLAVHGPAEVFRGQPSMYHWLLDHPDQAVLMWRRLGARCMEISNQGSGRFGWTDGQGSAVYWETVHSDGCMRIWYAEGQVRPGPLLPAVPARAVVVLCYLEGHDAVGRSILRHQADLFIQTDSKTAILITRMLGPSAPRLAEQGVAQMEMFFSALVWYLDHHPDRAEALLLGRGDSHPLPSHELHGN